MHVKYFQYSVLPQKYQRDILIRSPLRVYKVSLLSKELSELCFSPFPHYFSCLCSSQAQPLHCLNVAYRICGWLKWKQQTPYPTSWLRLSPHTCWQQCLVLSMLICNPEWRPFPPVCSSPYLTLQSFHKSKVVSEKTVFKNAWPSTNEFSYICLWLLTPRESLLPHSFYLPSRSEMKSRLIFLWNGFDCWMKWKQSDYISSGFTFMLR